MAHHNFFKKSGLTLTTLAAMTALAAASQAQKTALTAGGTITASQDVVSSNFAPNIFSGVNINKLLGADTFYNAGYTGTRATLTVVDSQLLWNQHISLTQNTVQIYNTDPYYTGSALGSFGDHGTAVANAAAGNAMGINANPVEKAKRQEAARGIAYGATLWAGAVGTTAPNAQGSFSATYGSFIYPYLTAAVTGVNGKTTDVFNTSLGNSDPTGYNTLAFTVDGLAKQTHKIFVAAAGNGGPGANTVGGQAAGYNVISVGATGTTSTTFLPTGDQQSPPFSKVAFFSSRSPNDFVYTQPNGSGAIIHGVRSRVDILAPGDSLTLAAYTGNPVDPNQRLYNSNEAGTSFASPIVAGGAALIVDAGYANFGGGAAIDEMVVKSVLQNSADKLAGWTNGQFVDGSGVVTTTQSVDYAQGAGQMNLKKAYTQYLGGTTGTPGGLGGSVKAIGWDNGLVGVGLHNDYRFTNTPTLGKNYTTFTGTLNWYVNREADNIDTTGSGGADFFDNGFADLDLELFQVNANSSLTLVGQSISLFNNTEHLNFNIFGTGDYVIRVDYLGNLYDNSGTNLFSNYGLAWSAVTVIPEPGSVALLVTMSVSGGLFIVRRRRK